MLSLMLAAAVLGAEPKPVPGSVYYAEAVETLDKTKSEKAFAAAVKKLNAKWAKKRIVVEFQVTNTINSIAYVEAKEKTGDWRTYVFQSWLPKRAAAGDALQIIGVPFIGETKAENEMGTLHAGGKSIKYRVDAARLEYKPGG